MSVFLTCFFYSWSPKVEITYSGVVNCSDVIMADGKRLILANIRCFLCGQSTGLKIKCDEDCCSRQNGNAQKYYHVTCARQAGLEVNVSGDDDLTFYSKTTMTFLLFVLC